MAAWTEKRETFGNAYYLNITPFTFWIWPQPDGTFSVTLNYSSSADRRGGFISSDSAKKWCKEYATNTLNICLTEIENIN